MSTKGDALQGLLLSNRRTGVSDRHEVNAMSVHILGVKVCAEVHGNGLHFSLGCSIKAPNNGLRVVSRFIRDRCGRGLFGQLLFLLIFFDDGGGMGRERGRAGGGSGGGGGGR